MQGLVTPVHWKNLWWFQRSPQQPPCFHSYIFGHWSCHPSERRNLVRHFSVHNENSLQREHIKQKKPITLSQQYHEGRTNASHLLLELTVPSSLNESSNNSWSRCRFFRATFELSLTTYTDNWSENFLRNSGLTLKLQITWKNLTCYPIGYEVQEWSALLQC